MDPTWESKCGTVKLWLGDCLDVMAGWPDGAVDAVVTDPPYDIAVDAAFVRTNRTDVHDGAGVWNDAGIGWRWLALLNDGVNIAAFHKRQDDSLPNGVTWWGRYYLLKEAPPPTPRPCFVSSVEECSVGTTGPRKGQWHGTGWEPNWWRGMTPSRLNRGVHPAQKPIDPIAVLVRCLSGAGQTIADPFMGSGTTGVAAVRLGRAFWGVEIDPNYFEVAKRRIQDELAKVAFLEPKSQERQGELFQ